MQESYGQRGDSSQIRDIGIPVRACSWVRLHAGRDGDGAPRIYAAMGQDGGNFFVLSLSPEDGSFAQFPAVGERSNNPTAQFVSRSGKLYVGAAYSGRLYCFDPDRAELQDLGEISPGEHTFTCRIDEDASGKLWIGGYPSADLVCFDPASGEFTRHGRMDETDMYSYPQVNADGMIACLIKMTRPRVVVFDQQTGEKRQVGPVAIKGRDSLDLVKAANGQLFITSSLGNYRLDGFEARSVDQVPKPAPSAPLSDGRSFEFADAAEMIFRKLRVTAPSEEPRVFELEYEAAGAELFCLHTGPDGLLYGSSMLPEHLLRYNPEDSELDDLGKCAAASGEAYSMANLDGKMYISSYPRAVISVYDPARPYHFGDAEEDNPRNLGRMDEVSYRPRSTLTGPLGRVWVASVPDYGMWGGPLSSFDPATGEKRSYPIAGEGSCFTLAHLEAESLLAVGTTVRGGTGTQPKAENAELILWDYSAEKVAWRGSPREPVPTINALLVLPDGRLLMPAASMADPYRLMVFDPGKREFAVVADSPGHGLLDNGLQIGPDGNVYGFSRDSIYRLQLPDLELEELVRTDGEFHVPGPIIGKDIYFATGPTLRAARLF
jgi:outer membrane protein assembly factor BamB